MIVFLHATLVLGPATKQATASITSQVFKYGKVTAALLPPYILEDLASSESHLSIARSLEFIGYGGAPLPSAIAEKFAPYTILMSVMGSTEVGLYFANVLPQTNPHHTSTSPAMSEPWAYHSFHTPMNLKFSHRTENPYEATLSEMTLIPVGNKSSSYTLSVKNLLQKIYSQNILVFGNMRVGWMIGLF